jgi:hypothetical protein
MGYVIEIKNSEQDIGLNHILYALGNDARKLDWAILYLWATGNLGDRKSLPDFERVIADSKTGFHLNWDDLCELSKRLIQVIDGVFVGCKDGSKIDRQDESVLADVCDIVIEANDSTVWRIHAKDHQLIQTLAARFGVEMTSERTKRGRLD